MENSGIDSIDQPQTIQCDLVEQELQVLAKHWINESVVDAMFTFRTCWTESGGFANSRFADVRALLSDEAFSQAMQEAEIRLKEQYGDEWEVFKTTLEPGIFAGSPDIRAIRRKFCDMVTQLPCLDEVRDSDGYSTVDGKYCLGAATSALRDCTEAIPVLETPVAIPPGATYADAVVLVESHMDQWQSKRSEVNDYSGC